MEKQIMNIANEMNLDLTGVDMNKLSMLVSEIVDNELRKAQVIIKDYEDNKITLRNTKKLLNEVCIDNEMLIEENEKLKDEYNGLERDWLDVLDELEEYKEEFGDLGDYDIEI